MIGQRIKELRVSRGMLQQELAEKVGKGATDICRLERGQRRVKVDDLPLFAAALDVTVMDLLQEPSQISA